MRARILSRRIKKLSLWAWVSEKKVRFEPGQEAEDYHFIGTPDYVAMIARSTEGKFPLVRQFRPCVEKRVWELPAGLLEKGEAPRKACRRELLEETGLCARRIHSLGFFYPDTGRLENREHVFFVETGPINPKFVPEPGMEVRFVSWSELCDMVRKRQFIHQQHIAVLFEYFIYQKTRQPRSRR